MPADTRPIYAWRDIRIDDVDSGAPVLTFQHAVTGELPQSFRLSTDAVTAIVRALIGVCEPRSGEVLVVVRASTADLARVLAAAKDGAK